jgi:hypothetical protein
MSFCDRKARTGSTQRRKPGLRASTPTGAAQRLRAVCAVFGMAVLSACGRSGSSNDTGTSNPALPKQLIHDGNLVFLTLGLTGSTIYRVAP